MKYTVYGKPGCVFCIKAKNLLERNSQKYDYVDIDEDAQAKHFVKEVLAAKKVPQIMLHKDDGTVEHVGGYTELEREI